MKFKESHRQDILQLLTDHGISKDQYSFRKRKGRIIISCGNSSTFSFYQTKDFDIDMVTRKRIDISHFEVIVNRGELHIVDDWEVVKGYLVTWIIGVKKGRNRGFS